MYIQQAYKGKTDWWRFVITFIIVVVAKLISEVPISVLAAKAALRNNDVGNIVNYTTNHELIGISSNLYVLTLFGPMVVVFGTIVICMHLIHGLSFRQVFTSYKKFRWKNFFIAAFIWLLFLSLVEFIQYQTNPDVYVFRFKGQEFFYLLLISLVFVPFQASAEELYFRGNLLQGFGMLFKSRIGALLITSILFGLMHFPNPEVKEFGIGPAMIQYIGFGLLLGIIVVMDGGMEMAFGIHSINNIYLMTMVSYSGTVVKTSSLFYTNKINVTVTTIGFVICAIAILFILKALFKWKSFKWLAKPLKPIEVGDEAV